MPDSRTPGPVQLLDVDLDAHEAAGAARLPGGGGDRWVVLRRGGLPVAMVELSPSDDDDAVAARLTALARTHPPVRRAWLAVADEDLPSATVVVPTLVRRLDDLGRCLESLAALDHPPFEVVVVDNRREVPADDPLVAMLAEKPGFRSVRTDRPGVAAARNVGLRAATGEVVAFTDDDVRVDPTWLRAFGARFAADPALAACTGLILPAELETPAQVWFERYFGGFAGERLFAPLTLRTAPGLFGRGSVVATADDGSTVRRAPLYGVGAYGAGASMALRRAPALAVGGFDAALGTGTPSTGGEDLRILMDLLWAGHPLRYEPAAAVWHRHRRGYDELTRQIRAGGTGLTATLTALVVGDPRHLLGLGVQLPVAVRRLAGSTLARLRGRRTDAPVPQEPTEPLFPTELVRLELGGMPSGPLAYLRSRRQQRRWTREHPEPGPA